MTILASRSTIRRENTVARSSLKIGDLFKLANGKNPNRVYMHTGARTNPPSTGRTSGATIGYQSIVVDGTPKSGSDGAAVTFDLNQNVVLVGKADIHGKFFA